MAKFKIGKFRYGYPDKDLEYYVSIYDIEFEENDKIVVLPDEFNGEPITHVGYFEEFVEAHEVWCDWHHPSKGSDWVPDKYQYDYSYVTVPNHVKMIVLPKTMNRYSHNMFKGTGEFVVVVDEENPYYVNEDGKIKWRKS